MKHLTVIGAGLLALFACFVISFAKEGEAGPVLVPGKALYETNCAMCHGATGKGKGPAAAALSSEPADLTSPKFWGNNGQKKIETAVSDGYGAMPPLDLKADEIKAVTDYMSNTFKK
jgi:mono/diheme cytochrome c family protein